jgi:hypothetical protein
MPERITVVLDGSRKRRKDAGLPRPLSLAYGYWDLVDFAQEHGYSKELAGTVWRLMVQAIKGQVYCSVSYVRKERLTVRSIQAAASRGPNEFLGMSEVRWPLFQEWADSLVTTP